MPLDDVILQYAIEGFAGKQLLTEEFWADLFMTAVLDTSNPGISEPYQVYSINKSIDELNEQLGARVFYNCTKHGGCDWRPVKWAEYKLAKKAQEHFPILLNKLLSE